MSERNGPQISPGNLNVAGAQIEIAGYVDPEQFPNGMEMVIMRPGVLEPVGTVVVRKGCMIGVIPPEMAQHLIRELKKVQAVANAPGKIRAPGT